MSETYVLVEQMQALNNVFQENFGLARRLKLLALDVSFKYIVFGASSGGIYIFDREPCQFRKLIPSQYGPAALISISENEDHLALATTTGYVLVLENCYTEVLFQQQSFSLHEGNTVTAMKWHDNALYCGDNIGKVSVVTLRMSMARVFFPTTDTCLMILDASIVQIDAYSKFLLVSTQTRTLLCDIESEKFKQVGKQPRDGLIGACFSHTGPSSTKIKRKPSQWRGLFRIVGDNEILSISQDKDDVKILCGRPGLRLWKADLKADVVSTVIFRDSAKIRATNLIHLNNDPKAKLRMTSFPEAVTAPPDLNFGQIFFLLDKFILTFKADAFYVFDVMSNALMLWCNYFHNIRDLKIVDSRLYIWRDDLQVDVVSLLKIEDLIMKTLLCKQYRLSAELCLEFRKDLEKILETSKTIHLILNLADNLECDRVILNKLQPFLDLVRVKSQQSQDSALRNAIVSVNNAYSTYFKPVKHSKLPKGPKSPVDQSLEISLVTRSGEKAEKSNFEIIANQYNLNKVGTNMQTTGFMNLLRSNDLNEISNMLYNFRTCLNNTEDEEGSDYWCKEMFLQHLSQNKDIEILEPSVLRYAGDAFLHMNEDASSACNCGFPLPRAHTRYPEFCELGVMLMEKLDDFEKFTRQVPYMNYFILKKLEDADLHEIELKICLVIQYSNYEIFRKLAKKFTYDIWDESIRLIAELKNGLCLYCGKNIDVRRSFEWNTFGTAMVQSINAINAVKLLKRHAHLIPDGTLDEFFYQYTVFQTATGVDATIGETLNAVLAEEPAKKEFGKSVGGYLRKKHVGAEADERPAPELLTNCDCCNLPLKTPIIDQVNKLGCGHTYHKLCLFHKKDKCYICDKTVL